MKNRGIVRGLLSLACASVLLIGGCTTLDPYTREEKTSHATKGAAIGAAAGAAVGLMSGDDAVERRERALIGAGIGALAGGLVGYYMDQQEMKLRQQLEGTGVSVTRMGNNITLNMPGNVTFATDSADLYSGFFRVLDSVALVVNEFDQTIIEVAGHTDSTGSMQHNQDLSERRALGVGEYLRTREVLAERIMTIGLGESHPVADNETETGRQLNRRVELTLVPLTV